jgi:AraC-like DNA-binding protein
MSYTTDRYRLENVNISDLTLTSCGITTNHPSHTSGKRVYREYSLSFILKGAGIYIVNGKTYQLKAGEGFVIIPDMLNEYIGDRSSPWEYIYVTFTGEGATKLLKDMGLNIEAPTFTFPEEIIPTLYSMHQAGKNKALKGYAVWGNFLLIISKLVSKINHSPLWVPENYVEKAKRFIMDNYSYNINVSNVAFSIGIDRTYLYRLFIAHEKVSPSKYILNVRLNEAARKLRETDASITRIALSSGFNDAPHFYKAFYSQFNISPKKYRDGQIQ